MFGEKKERMKKKKKKGDGCEELKGCQENSPRGKNTFFATGEHSPARTLTL